MFEEDAVDYECDGTDEGIEEILVCQECGNPNFMVNTDGEMTCTFCGEVHELVDEDEEDEE